MDARRFVESFADTACADLPVGACVRYFRPHATLATAITGYNCYGQLSLERRDDRFLPAPVMICIAVDAGPVAVELGRHRFDPVAPASLYGATTRPLQVTTHGGLMIGIGISPVGWARLGMRAASDFQNRVISLDRVLPHHFVDRLCASLAGLNDAEAIPATLDALLAPLMADPHPMEPLIEAFGALIVRDGDPDIAGAADELSISTAALRRLAVRYFGMPPKILLRRARFLRSFLRDKAIRLAAGDPAIDASYFDQSHYLRDARSFLGTTPRRFLAGPNAFLLASLRARAAALGAPTQALHGSARIGDTMPVATKAGDVLVTT